jgi:hypothetical protein
MKFIILKGVYIEKINDLQEIAGDALGFAGVCFEVCPAACSLRG